MKKLLIVLVAVAALIALALGASRASGASAGGPANLGGRVHMLLTSPALAAQRAVGVSTGCLGTGSPGCVPIPLQYNGGPVEATGSKNYMIFWEPTGSVVATNYNATLAQFFGDVGGSTLYGVATQYYQTTGSTQQNIANTSAAGGTWTDTSTYPSTTLQDSDMQAEVSKAIAANHWPTGIGNEYFVFLAQGENECMGSSCSFSNYCAYHGDYALSGATVLYAAMPYAGTDLAGCGIQTGGGTPNGAATDAEISVASHEMMETVTDPLLSAWFDASGSEIGDKCAYTYGPTAANGSDLTINGHPYIVQEEFSNSAVGCAV